MSYPITANMVQEIEISDMCLESHPCQHECKITLTDGRETTRNIGGPNIDSLISAISKNKIKSDWPLDHFSYKSFKQDTAPDILTRIFKP